MDAAQAALKSTWGEVEEELARVNARLPAHAPTLKVWYEVPASYGRQFVRRGSVQHRSFDMLTTDNVKSLTELVNTRLFTYGGHQREPSEAVVVCEAVISSPTSFQVPSYSQILQPFYPLVTPEKPGLKERVRDMT